MANAEWSPPSLWEGLAAPPGLGHGTARTARVVRMVDRLLLFGLARWHDDAFEVRQSVPRLTERQLRRLRPMLQAANDHAVAG
jgi:hypothetical protein